MRSHLRVLTKRAKFTAYREGKFAELTLWARGVKFSGYFFGFYGVFGK
jgi:hypothetical protein